jgi:hypothetical protein
MSRPKSKAIKCEGKVLNPESGRYRACGGFPTQSTLLNGSYSHELPSHHFFCTECFERMTRESSNFIHRQTDSSWGHEWAADSRISTRGRTITRSVYGRGMRTTSTVRAARVIDPNQEGTVSPANWSELVIDMEGIGLPPSVPAPASQQRESSFFELRYLLNQDGSVTNTPTREVEIDNGQTTPFENEGGN